jgi:CHAD domain-containing protein
MADELRENESGTRGVRRLIRKQIRKALEALGVPRPLDDGAVHTARKQLKRVRANLRLLRQALGPRTYQRENAWAREAAEPLTAVRDAKILLETLVGLAEHFPGALNKQTLARVRRALERHRKEVRHRVLEDGDLLPLTAALEAVRERLARWPVGRRGWSVLGAGLKRVYRNGRAAFRTAEQAPSVENLHEWRKQAKYLRYQLEALRRTWPAALEGLATEARLLTDRLGDDHDLAVLRQTLQEQPERFPDRRAVERLLELIDRRRVELQEDAWNFGRHLYADRPQAFVDRLGDCWHAWRSQAPQAVDV